MEEVLAVTFIFGGGTLFLLSISPVGKALAERIRSRSAASSDPAVLEELQRVREEVAELQERLDFTERLLAQQRESAQLERG